MPACRAQLNQPGRQRRSMCAELSMQVPGLLHKDATGSLQSPHESAGTCSRPWLTVQCQGRACIIQGDAAARQGCTVCLQHETPHHACTLRGDICVSSHQDHSASGCCPGAQQCCRLSGCMPGSTAAGQAMRLFAVLPSSSRRCEGWHLVPLGEAAAPGPGVAERGGFWMLGLSCRLSLLLLLLQLGAVRGVTKGAEHWPCRQRIPVGCMLHSLRRDRQALCTVWPRQLGGCACLDSWHGMWCRTKGAAKTWRPWLVVLIMRAAL